MAVLLDTGILLRGLVPQDAAAAEIRRSARALYRREERLVTTMQNVAEFWNVATRPQNARGGFGCSASFLEPRLRFIERYCEILTESPQAYELWRELVFQHSLSGVSVHDARLVAVMLANGVSQILTLNGADFRRYAGIAVVAPSEFE
jgi:predicted nucleic acid-binding protein